MVPEVADVERALLALDPGDRAAVIERGLLSLDDADDVEQAEIDAAWLAEVNRRVDRHVNGDATSIDVAQHLAAARARLTDRTR